MLFQAFVYSFTDSLRGLDHLTEPRSILVFYEMICVAVGSSKSLLTIIHESEVAFSHSYYT